MKALCLSISALFLTVPMLAQAAPPAAGNAHVGIGANYWSGLSSRNWHGGGVDYVLAGWKSEAAGAAPAQPAAPPAAQSALEPSEESGTPDLH